MNARTRRRKAYTRRYLKAGGCATCGQPRARLTQRRRRPSSRFCPYHLATNRRYQRRWRERLKRR
jgi:hypothetical protein